MPLTDGDRERIRYHLGYINVGATNNNSTSFPAPGAPGNAASVQFSIPRPVEALFIVEQSFNLILEIAIPRIRRILSEMDNVENQISSAPLRAAADTVGSIKLRSAVKGQSELDMLDRLYQAWGGRLADILGVPYYPYSKRFMAGAGDGPIARNVPVRN